MADSLLLHLNGADGATQFWDTLAHPLTRGGTPTISTTQSKFGGASGRFASAQYIETPDHADWDLSAGDSTVDCWLYLSTLAAFASILGQNRAAADGHWFLYVYADGKVACGRAGVNEVATTAGAITTGAWHHVAVTRASGNTRIFIDGVVQAGPSATNPFNDATPALRVGSLFDASFDGWIDEAHIDKGTALWTANFTPPTSAYGTTAERAAPIPIESLAVLQARPRIPFDAIGWARRGALIPVEWLGQVRSLYIPVEWRQGAERASRLPVESLGGLGRRVPIPVEAKGWTVRRIPLSWESDGIKWYQFPLTFSVLHLLDAILPLEFRVLADPILGADLPITFTVFEALPPLELTFDVIPAETVDLYEAKGTGAAAGLPVDVQLPAATVTKT